MSAGVLTEHFDALETRDPEVRERAVLAALRKQVAFAKQHAPAFASILVDIDPEAIMSRADLAHVPVTRKSDLVERQKASRPFGGLAATTRGSAAHVFASPGPIYEPGGRGADYWRLARSLFAAGFRAGDLVHNCYAYHLTPAGSMLETGALALGCTVFPGGTGQTELQVQAMADLRPDGYVGTPSFLRIILERADADNVALPWLTKAQVSGEPFPPSLRDALKARGIDGYQVYASADLGSIAYETPAREGLVVDEGVLVEILRPGTGDAVADGEVGEVVVTTLANTDYPLIRFGTGDLSATMPGRSSCGRTNARIKGWMGRADQTTKVKGMFVHPAQVAAVLRRHAGIAKGRLVVDNPGGVDRMTLLCELRGGAAAVDAALVAAVIDSLREVTKLRGEVALREPGTLPNDGKVIDDTRKYE
jgi:phenylacetate-CoA ligase